MKAAGINFLVSLLPGALVSLPLWFSSTAQAAFTEQSLTLFTATRPSIDSRSASLADIDNDGDLDMFFQTTGTGQRLYRNNLIGLGTFNFTNITSSHITGQGLTSSWSAAWGDYDGDGLVDVFVGQTNGEPETGDILRNTGSGFTNTSVNVGLTDPGFHQNVAWNDIDGDLDLDLIIAMEGPVEKHEIYIQDESHHFTPVGAAVGFQELVGTKSYGMAIGDSDGDGDRDIYISTCWEGLSIRNNFYKNLTAETGALAFEDIADSNGTQYMPNSYNAEFQDFDNDGDLDLFVAGADGFQSKIFRNDGGNVFTDVDAITGHVLLSETGGDFNGGRAVDYDNDGDLDLYFHDQHSTSGNDFARKLFRNDGNWTFADVTSAEGLHETNRGAFDSSWGDLDRDGDQDLVAPTAGTGFFERMFINNASTNGNKWLYIDLLGQAPNTTAIGATVYATMNNGAEQILTLRRETNTNAGTFNQSDLPVHFGFGTATMIDQLRIVWPDGTMQYLFDVATNQYLQIAYAGEMPGDFNHDGIVNSADYVVWRKGLNDRYTQVDYNLWRTHLGETSGSGSGGASVPEPASAAIILLLAVISWTQRGRLGRYSRPALRPG